MIRHLLALATVAVLSAAPLGAQDFSARAHLDPGQSALRDLSDGVELTLGLSQPVPYRVQLWRDPARLVLDFRTVTFDRLGRGDLRTSRQLLRARYGRAEGGWTRLVFDLAAPMRVELAGLSTDAASGRARLEVRLAPTTAEDFARLAHKAPEVLDPAPEAVLPRPPIIALDPGHGGSDTGTIRGDQSESEVMLVFARILRAALRREGAEVVLTRSEDQFVSLDGRLKAAQVVGADLLLSLQADAPLMGAPEGAQVMTLAAEAEAAATGQLTLRRPRDALVRGIDLRAQEDRTARVLLSLARMESAPRSARLAEALAGALAAPDLGLQGAGVGEARASVLKSADMPSLLVNLGDVTGRPGWSETQGLVAQRLAATVLSWWSEMQSEAAGG